MSASVILVAYYADSWLPACLDSLVRASSQQLHLVLVDNAGNTIINKLDLSKFEFEILQAPEPMGFAEANNFALMNASHLNETVLFLNQDTVSHVGWIDQCMSCLNENMELGAVSPLIHTYDGLFWDPSFLDCLPLGVVSQLQEEDVATSNWIYTNNVPAPSLVVRTHVLYQTGPFDPVYGSYYEDFDLCRRIKKLGYRVGFCRTANINHYSGSATTDRDRELRRMRQIIRNRIIFQLRDSENSRLFMALRFGLWDFPMRFMRGILRTASSQPPLVVLKAHSDLLKIINRVLSRKRDEAIWQNYLDEIGWSDLAIKK